MNAHIDGDLFDALRDEMNKRARAICAVLADSIAERATIPIELNGDRYTVTVQRHFGAIVELMGGDDE